MESAERIDVELEPRRARWALPWRRRPSRKAVLIILAATVIAAGLFLGWSWVVAAGLSSIMLGLLPCAAMCAAGLCMKRYGQKNACAGSSETSVVGKPVAERIASKGINPRALGRRHGP
jgi:hypothetical protein